MRPCWAATWNVEEKYQKQEKYCGTVVSSLFRFFISSHLHLYMHVSSKFSCHLHLTIVHTGTYKNLPSMVFVRTAKIFPFIHVFSPFWHWNKDEFLHLYLGDIVRRNGCVVYSLCMNIFWVIWQQCNKNSDISFSSKALVAIRSVFLLFSLLHLKHIKIYAL